MSRIKPGYERRVKTVIVNIYAITNSNKTNNYLPSQIKEHVTYANENVDINKTNNFV